MLKRVVILVFFLIVGKVTTSCAQRIGLEYCKIWGRIYVVSDKNKADFRVYVEESDAFANIAVYQHTNKLYADRPGHWFFTNNRAEADFWIYLEPIKGFADFSIAYVETESFAGCKQ